MDTALEVVVVDDASSDDSAAMVKREFPWARLVVHRDNLGFAATCNDGAKEAHGEWLLFLNSDAFVSPDQIWRLRQLAENLGAAGIGPQLVSGTGVPQDSGGALPSPSSIIRTKLGRLLGADLNKASHRRVVRGTPRCGWITGACLLVRADMFRSLGGFDDRLVYVEDVDLGVRITRQGGKLFLTDQTVVTHLGGESFSLIATTVPRLYRESQRLLARIHLRPCERAVFAAGLEAESLVRRLTGAGRRVLG